VFYGKHGANCSYICFKKLPHQINFVTSTITKKLLLEIQMKKLSFLACLVALTFISGCGKDSSSPSNGATGEPIIIAPLKDDLEQKINNFFQESALTKDNKIKVISMVNNDLANNFIFSKSGSFSSSTKVNLTRHVLSQAIFTTNGTECLVISDEMESIVENDGTKMKLYKRDINEPKNIDPKETCQKTVWSKSKNVVIEWTDNYNSWDVSSAKGSFYLAKLQGNEVIIHYLAQSKNNYELISIYSPERSLFQNATLYIQRKRDTGSNKRFYIETNNSVSDTYISSSEYAGIEINDYTK